MMLLLTVLLTLRTYAANVDVVAGPKLLVTAADSRVHPTLRQAGGGRIEVEFDGKRQLHEGALRVEVPAGTAIDVSTVLGRVTVTGTGGAARVRGMSGAVTVAGASEVDVETVDGDIDVADTAGKVRIHTTSGKSTVAAASLGEVELETASGNAAFRGACAARCHVDVDSVSGEVRVSLGPESSFATSAITTSGHVRDSLGLSLHHRESWTEGKFRGGDGAIECETFSGDIVFSPP
jgi:DUF4097 and DUF4098 domain-containing protein YvlB